MKNTLGYKFNPEAHAIFINKFGNQVIFEGENKCLEATKFLGKYAVLPFQIENELKEDYAQISDVYTIETEKGHIHLANIIYKGGKYA